MKKLFSFKDKNNEKEYEFALKQPNRTEREEIEIYYAAMLSKLMNMGVQTKASVDKYYADSSDTAVPKKDQSYYFNLQKDLAQYQEDLIREKSNSDKKFEIYAKIVQIQEDMRKFTSYYSAIYDNTAEVKARDKTVDFCMLNYSYSNEEELFPQEEEDFQKRAILQYEQIDKLREGEDSEFWNSVIDRFVFLFTIWYLDLAQTDEEFKSYYDSYFKAEDEQPDTEEKDSEEDSEEEVLDKKED
jgi:hypothetical protein